jgi:hypothetical protein
MVGDFLRERLNELPVIQEKRYKPVVGSMPDWENKSVGARAYKAERLAANALTIEEREEIIRKLTARVLSDLSICFRRKNRGNP